MNKIKKALGWLNREGKKLFIDTKSSAVRTNERLLWLRFSQGGVNTVFALKNKDLDVILGSVADILTIKKEYEDLKTLAKFVEGNSDLEIADTRNNEYHIYHNNGEWYKIRESNGEYVIFFFDAEDQNHIKKNAISLGAVLMDLHHYLSDKKMEELIDYYNNDDEDEYDDEDNWMREEGIVGWCKRRKGATIKLSPCNNKEYPPEYIIILNKQYVFKLKSNKENNLLYLMPHSKQEDLVKVGSEKEIVEYLEKKLNKAMSN